MLSTTGELLSKMAGKAWADADVAGVENAKKVGVKMGEFSAEDQAKFARSPRRSAPRWSKEVSAKGVDAEAALTFIEETMKSYGK